MAAVGRRQAAAVGRRQVAGVERRQAAVHPVIYLYFLVLAVFCLSSTHAGRSVSLLLAEYSLTMQCLSCSSFSSCLGNRIE